MIRVKINLDKKLTDLRYKNITHYIGSQAVKLTSELTYNDWVSKAQDSLNSRRQSYISAIKKFYPYNNDDLQAVIKLDTSFSRMIEEGSPPFDMKRGFVNSTKKTTTSKGWYLTIPIRHGTPETFQYGSPMPKEVYTLAKKLNAGQKLSITGNLGTSFTGYNHKNNIYDGMRKVIHSYKNSAQSQYVTFRRVSNNSDPSSWYHPGFKPISLIPKVASNVQSNLEKSVEAVISTMLK